MPSNAANSFPESTTYPRQINRRNHNCSGDSSQYSLQKTWPLITPLTKFFSGFPRKTAKKLRQRSTYVHYSAFHMSVQGRAKTGYWTLMADPWLKIKRSDG